MFNININLIFYILKQTLKYGLIFCSVYLLAHLLFGVHLYEKIYINLLEALALISFIHFFTSNILKNHQKLTQNLITIVIVGIYFLLSYHLVLNHEIWRDEAQSFLLMRESMSLIELFRNTAHEGHPIFWHTLAMPIVHIFNSVRSFQLFHICISTTSVYILLKFSPFNFKIKILLIFSYFLFYEYNIFSRSYSLAVLLIFCMLSLYRSIEKHWFLVGLLIFLISNINAISLIYAIGFLTTHIFVVLVSRDNIRKNIYIIVIGLLGVATSIAQMVRSGFREHIHAESMQETIKAIFQAFFPLPKVEISFWQTCILLNNETLRSICLILFLLLVSVLLIRLAIDLKALLFFVITETGYLLFFNYIYPPSIYHSGFMFITLISSEWILKNNKNQNNMYQDSYIRNNTLFNYLFSLMLCLHVGSGMIAYLIDYKNEFSGSLSVSEYLEKTELKNTPMVFYPDFISSGVLAYSGIKYFYSPNSGKPTNFIKWGKERKHNIAFDELYDFVISTIKEKQSDIILISYIKIPDSFFGKLLFQTEKQIRDDESMFVYIINKNIMHKSQ